MNKGTVKWFNADKGYGFISDSEGRGEIFVHHTGINMDGYRRLEDGQGVEFEIIETEKGKQAVNVTVVEQLAEIIVEGEEDICQQQEI